MYNIVYGTNKNQSVCLSVCLSELRQRVGTVGRTSISSSYSRFNHADYILLYADLENERTQEHIRHRPKAIVDLK